MGLFSVLSQSTNKNGEDVPTPSNTTTTISSGTLPTILQLFTGDDLIQLETEVSAVTKYSTLTYQAIQVGSPFFLEEEEATDGSTTKPHRPPPHHTVPDLGVWNCRGTNTTSNNKSDNLVDSLLDTLVHHQQIRAYCITVDLANPNQVEPTLLLLQTALVRHLIEHPPPSSSTSPTTDETESPTTTAPTVVERQTATTSLYDLQGTEFGKATNEEKSTTSTREEGNTTSGGNKKMNQLNDSFRDVKITLMICAKLAAPMGEEGGVGGEEDDAYYKTKQAQALVIYHLRKFASSLNCTLCFVEPPNSNKKNNNNAHNNNNKNTGDGTNGLTLTTSPSFSSSTLHPTVDYYTLGKYWLDLALDVKIWEDTHTTGSIKPTPSMDDDEGGDDDDDTNNKENVTNTTTIATTPETVEVASPLYGPGKHMEDLIESVVLRSAHYPGHWDASKDSLWVALPPPKKKDEDDPTNPTSSSTTGGSSSSLVKGGGGDAGWLGQLRESIASAADAMAAAAAAAGSPDKKSLADGEKNDGKDAADVSDFFASLLKNP